MRLQVSRCLPLLRFPCGFHLRALLATCSSGLLSVWPVQLHARFFISSSIARCSVRLHSSSFRTLLGHQIRRMLLRHFSMNTCNFCFNSLVGLQVSASYKSTAFTFNPKTLNLVLVVSAVDRYYILSIANACLAFPMCSWMSSSRDVVRDHWMPRLLAKAVLVTQSKVTRKSKGDSRQPCLTPVLMLNGTVFCPLCTTCAEKPSYRALMMVAILTDIP